MAPRSPQTMVAEQLARSGAIAAAVEACYEALPISKDEPFVHALLADLLLANDFHDEAIAEATTAIELDPDCVPAYLALGLAYDRRGGMWDQSLLVWHELAEVAPHLVIAHVQLGEAYAAAGFPEEAIDSWRQALQLDGTEARAMYNLAVSALNREGIATALPGFRKAGELDRSQDELYFYLAGIPDGTAPTATSTASPADRAGRLAVAGALARAEDILGASDFVRAQLDEDPDDAEALGLAAYCYVKQEAFNEALACSLRSLALAPAEPALYCLGVCYVRRPGLDEHAARVFDSLARTVPDHAMPHVLRAEALLGLQKYSSAKASYVRALSLDPACVRARFGLAAVLLTEGKDAEASWEIGRAAYHDTRRQGLFRRLYDEYAESGGAS
jgi:tetratricopeptide (TPR) repeat protein